MQPKYGVTPPARRSKTRKRLMIVVGVAVLLVCGCAGLGKLVEPDHPAAQLQAVGGPTLAPTTAATIAAAPPAPVRTSASPGPTVVLVAVPAVVGENAAVALDQLQQLGFTRVQLGSQDVDNTVVLMATNWTVTRQSTPAGRRVPTDSLIVLTCTKHT